MGWALARRSRARGPGGSLGWLALGAPAGLWLGPGRGTGRRRGRGGEGRGGEGAGLWVG